MDWNEPALPAAVSYFVRHYLDEETKRLDLDRVLVVVPGSRAGRRLSQLLAAEAAQMHVPLFPPQIQTVGQLPEHLYEPKRPFADELTQQLAWVEAIKSQKARAKKFFPHLPANKETVDWLDLAAMLARVHRELAAEGLDFGDVVEQGRRLRGFAESRRWRFLRSLQESYLDVLDGLKLWDLQTARLFAIKQNECQTDDDIFLLGTVDLNQATRQMLNQLKSPVVALIHAPESEALGFDDYGCLEPYYWKDKRIPIEDDQIIVTDQPEDQAQAVCHLLGQMEGSTGTDDVVVGVPASEVAPYIERKLENHNIKTHWAVGRSIKDSSPAKLLTAICAVIELDRYPEMAALIRHPDIESWLDSLVDTDPNVAAQDVVKESDAYYVEHIIPQFGTWLGNKKRHRSLRWAIGKIQELLKPLRQKPMPFSRWAEPILELLGAVYANLQLDRENENHKITIDALSQTRALLEPILEIPESLDLKTDAVNVMRYLLQKLGQQSASSPPEVNSIELLGWLELPLDIADSVIVTSFNEGSIPESLNADMFLPNSLRQALQLTDNQRRFARDAYAVSSMVHSKKHLSLIIGKRDLTGDPLTPSRIYFATDRETIAQRVLKFSKPTEFVEPDVSTDALPESQFYVPYPELEGVTVDSIRVTSFRTYLKCPYRFYLQHVLGLQSVHDQDREFNGLMYGNLLHEIFQKFGESRLRYSEIESEISDYLESQLDEITHTRFGTRRLPAVEIQLQQMRHRLMAFAKWQSIRTKEGWEIRFVEKKPVDPRGVDFEFDKDRHVKIRGMIDRIDFHEPSNVWQILDYKTGDKGDPPHKTHLEKGEWVDLQLPLYQHIAKTFEVDGNVQLGYILIPKDLKEVGESIAPWQPSEIEEAINVAKKCAKNIVELKFWEPTHPAPPYIGQEFAPICQDNVFEPKLGAPPDLEPVSTGGAS